jgi:SAM-dependent methyltransferase
MINALHAMLHNPRRGWDPIPEEHARLYAEEQWQKFNPGLVDYLADRLCGLEGKRVLDLGAGPGHFSVAFARCGAQVTWHDLSRRYLDFSREKARQAGVTLRFSLGYLEEAGKFLAEPFDLVFCRICWRYCENDRRFARLVYGLAAPEGAGYVDSGIGPGPEPTLWRRIQFDLNAGCGLKIGHPDPPRGRLAGLFQGFPMKSLETDYSAAQNDRIFFVTKRQPEMV